MAEYLARSTSALCAFYGGLVLVLVLARDVRRHRAVIRYQALAILLLSAADVLVSLDSGPQQRCILADAAACWAYAVPMLVLERRPPSGD